MKNTIFILSLVLCIACSKNSDINDTPVAPNNQNTNWLIPQAEVLDGGPGIDGIPSIDNPKFNTVDRIDFLKDNDLVVGIIDEGMVKAYPHPILDWHEIVNDVVNDKNVALTYCPLTGTGVAWDRNVNGNITEFGVSGKLYNTNLIPYDRETGSYWSQMRLDCVRGDLVETKISTFHSIETTWKTWKTAYPNSLVLDTNTGFSRNYERFPYGDYRTNHNNIIFPVSKTDRRLPAKERVLAIITDNQKRVYSIELFTENKVITDQINDEEIIVIGSKADNFVVAYKNIEGSNWSYVENQLPIIATDQLGNTIDLSGKITDGPNANNQLQPVSTQFMGYFFAFGTFYIDIDIYEE